MHNTMSRAVIGFITFSAFAGLSGCAVSTPPLTKSTILPMSTIGSVEFPTEENAGSLRGQWADALRKALQKRHVSFAGNAPFIADYAVSIRSTETGIAKAGTPDSQTEWQSQARDRGLIEKTLGNCRAQRMRGTLVIFDRASGAIAYRGSSEADSCGTDQNFLATMASQLVTEATS